MQEKYTDTDLNKDILEHEKFFSGEIKFSYGSQFVEQLPSVYFPQIAFFGKSNVGKSSLINYLTNRKSLARTSHTPGRTQQINFFNVKEKFFIVDLPGYGYAKISKSQHANWENLIITYLERASNLKLILLLIDSRRGIKENDLQVINILGSFGKKYWIIFTKSDKIGKSEKKIIHDNLISKINQMNFNISKDLELDNKIFYTNNRNLEDAKKFKITFWRYIKESILD